MPRLTVNGIGLYYEMADDTRFWEPHRTPLLFLHGLGVDHSIWRQQVAAFAASHPIIVVDTRGHGRSDSPGDYAIASHARDIASLIDALVYEPVHLVGTSMGGLIAQQVAAARPDLVRSLVLIGTFCEAPTSVQTDKLLPIFDAAPTLDAYYRPIIGRAHPPDLDPAIFDLIHSLTTHHDRAVLRAGTIATFGYNDPEAAQRIAAPTLVMTASHEGAIGLPQAQRLVDLISDARLLTLQNAGHAAYLEAPDAFNDALRTFLNEVEGRTETA